MTFIEFQPEPVTKFSIVWVVYHERHVKKAQPVDLGGVEIYRPGTIVGKALEPLSSGTGLIEVFVTLQ